jgi:hypothetical protein
VSLWYPKEQVQSILELTPEWAEARGIAGIIFDLDNTLVPHGYEGVAEAEILAWLGILHEAGFMVRVVSNASRRRWGRWGEKLGLEGRAMAGKPWPRAFAKAMFSMGLPPKQVAVVGDQIFTDILGGNLMGAYTVWVPPLSLQGLPHTKFIRSLERRILEDK